MILASVGKAAFLFALFVAVMAISCFGERYANRGPGR